jgi:carboxysome shell carbonic anhydrase
VIASAQKSKRSRPEARFQGYGYSFAAPAAVADPYQRLFGAAPARFNSTPSGAHPLHDAAHSRRLLAREGEIVAAFAAIEPALREIAAMQLQPDFAERAQALALDRLGYELPAARLQANWIAPLDMRALYATCVFRTFQRLAARALDQGEAELAAGETAAELIRRWGFHAIDISPCADGRLSGVVDYILRLPQAVVAHRKSFAGAMFDVEESLRNWASVELGRHRDNAPNPASEPTRYLKIGVYHRSSSNPTHEGCAAHGSDERKAAQALLDRLYDFAQAVANSYCCAASVATLLIGVDTDTDAIKVHVPDAEGRISLGRFVDSFALFDQTRLLAREVAKEAIRQAVAEVAGTAPDDAATEGMRWLCGYLLKNNLPQIEYVRAHHGGRYADLGHSERLIVVGDSFDDVQLRNLAYQAQMETVEEGAADMDVGMHIFEKVNQSRGFPIPVLVHLRYDGKVPGSRERAIKRGRRLERAIRARYPQAVSGGWLHSCLTVTDRAPTGRLEEIADAVSAAEHAA